MSSPGRRKRRRRRSAFDSRATELLRQWGFSGCLSWQKTKEDRGRNSGLVGQSWHVLVLRSTPLWAKLGGSSFLQITHADKWWLQNYPADNGLFLWGYRENCSPPLLRLLLSVLMHSTCTWYSWLELLVTVEPRPFPHFQLPTIISPGSLKVPPQFLLLISQQGGQSSWGVWERKRLQTLLEATEMGEDKTKGKTEGWRVKEEFVISCVTRKGGKGLLVRKRK